MKNSRLITAVVAAILLGAAPVAPVANAASEDIIRSDGGVTYVSGGVGTESADRLSAMARDFNLKLVFALKSGDYLSGVNVSIANAAGKTLVATTSEGPWFLTKLPAGNYQIVATFDGAAQKRSIAVGGDKLRTVDFRWASDERREVSSAK